MTTTELDLHRTNGAATTSAAPQFSVAQLDLIKTQIAKDASDDELALFLAVCNRTGLDPFNREIFALKRWDGKSQVMSIQTGIAGFRKIAEETGGYAGQEGPFWCGPDGQWQRDAQGEPMPWLSTEPPAAALVIALKLTPGGTIGRFRGIAHYTEYVQTTRDGNPNSMWSRMPANQLGKCAEALALRKAFPSRLNGLYTTDEMGQAENAEPTTPISNGRRASTVTGEVVTTTAQAAQPSTTRRASPARDAAASGELNPNAVKMHLIKYYMTQDIARGAAIKTAEEFVKAHELEGKSMPKADLDCLIEQTEAAAQPAEIVAMPQRGVDEDLAHARTLLDDDEGPF